MDSPQGQQLLRDFSVDPARLPALVCHDGTVLHNPSFAEIAGAHGIQVQAAAEIHDLAILGAGPAGLAAAVYGASEGLRTVVIEQLAIGGQAGTSSLIRNYLGFPRGLSGGDLAHRAWQQAVLFGAQFAFTHGAIRLTTTGGNQVITLDDESEVVSRAVIIATGVTYRRLNIPSLDQFVGTGVFYGAAGVEAPAMAGQEVFVIGGANSAGQTALHLARFANRVTLLVRGQSLAAGMSDYLVRQLEETPNVEVRLDACGRRPRQNPPRSSHVRESPHGSTRGSPCNSRVRAHWRGTAHRLASRCCEARRARVHPYRPRHSAICMAWTTGTAAV